MDLLDYVDLMALHIRTTEIRGSSGHAAQCTPMLSSYKGEKNICISAVPGGSQELTVLEAKGSVTVSEWQMYPILTGPETLRRSQERVLQGRKKVSVGFQYSSLQDGGHLVAIYLAWSL